MALESILSNEVLSAGYASLALRVVVGILFLVHGWPKIKNPKMMAGFLGGMGFKPGIFWSVLLAVTEFFGGIAILLGLYVRAAAIPLVISMSVASYLKIFVWKSKFASDKDNPSGYEIDLLALGGLIALFFLGSGSLSVSSLF